MKPAPANQPRPGEMPYKEWITETARRRGVTLQAIYNQVIRGRLKVKLRRVNTRVLFVQIR